MEDARVRKTQVQSVRLTVVMAIVELVCRRDSWRNSEETESRDCDNDASGRTESSPLSCAATDDAVAIKLIAANNFTNHAIVPCRLERKADRWRRVSTNDGVAPKPSTKQLESVEGLSVVDA